MEEPQHVLDVTIDSNTNEAPTAQATSSTSTKEKRKKKHGNSKPHVLTQLTLRNPPWAYIRLQHLNSHTTSGGLDLDALTANLHLNAALSQFLGLHGAAIAFDILKLDGADVWIRVAGEHRAAIVAAAGGWVSGEGEGWRVKGWSSWSAGNVLGKEGGKDLFTP